MRFSPYNKNIGVNKKSDKTKHLLSIVCCWNSPDAPPGTDLNPTEGVLWYLTPAGQQQIPKVLPAVSCSQHTSELLLFFCFFSQHRSQMMDCIGICGQFNTPNWLSCSSNQLWTLYFFFQSCIWLLSGSSLLTKSHVSIFLCCIMSPWQRTGTTHLMKV